jgi:hypothetical protein
MFGKSNCTASGPAQTAALARGMPKPRAHASLLRASALEALYQEGKHRQHQWRDAEQRKIHEKTHPHCSVSKLASSRSETSLAGSFLHATFEIRG